MSLLSEMVYKILHEGGLRSQPFQKAWTEEVSFAAKKAGVDKFWVDSVIRQISDVRFVASGISKAKFTNKSFPEKGKFLFHVDKTNKDFELYLTRDKWLVKQI